MAVIKPLNETPAQRSRRVLARLGVPDSSGIASLGMLAGVVALALIVIGLVVGGLASGIMQGYVDQLRELWTEP